MYSICAHAEPVVPNGRPGQSFAEGRGATSAVPDSLSPPGATSTLAPRYRSCSSLETSTVGRTVRVWCRGERPIKGNTGGARPNAPRGRRERMAQCEVCGNDYDKAFEI